MLQKPELLKVAANFILNDIAGQRKKDAAWPMPAAEFLCEVVRKYASGELASPQAKSSILTGTWRRTADAGLLPAIAQKVIDANPAVVADYKAGKEPRCSF
jgi:Asp-tRNA(Asn)/Glu-tRNA(Gln) amidotransferase B subunit